MLVENKFIYVSLPRCASTAFMASCVKQNLNIKHLQDKVNIENQVKKYGYDDINTIDFNNFEIFFDHSHEPLIALKEKFGYSYDIISVRRDKYERFISLWKHILRMFYLKNMINTFNICSSLTIDDILFYKTNDIQSKDTTKEQVEIFVKKHKLDDITEYGKEMIRIIMSPYSRWHNHDSDIIWFDFNELYKLEEWVSKKLDMEFKLIRMNSSKHYNCNIILNDKLKEKYDSIYLPYDEVKIVKTLF